MEVAGLSIADIVLNIAYHSYSALRWVAVWVILNILFTEVGFFFLCVCVCVWGGGGLLVFVQFSFVCFLASFFFFFF